MRFLNLLFLIILVVACGSESALVDSRTSLFNGKNLSGWVNVVGSEDTWSVSDASINATGTPKSVLRTEKQYENYILELDYQVQDHDGQAGVILHSDALPAVGQPWPKGINIRLEGETSAITSIADAKIESVSQFSPSDASSPLVEDKKWNHCKIKSHNGRITLAINGHVVSTANYASPRKGYISLKSNGHEVQFQNIHVEESPSSSPGQYEVASTNNGFVALYNGSDLSSHWQMKPGHQDHWTSQDWVINYDGKSEEQDKSLWTKKKYRDFILIADMRFTRKPKPDMLPVVLPSGEEAKNEDGSSQMVEVPYAGDTGIYVRGSSKNQINMGNRYIGSGEIYGYRVDESMPLEVRRAVVPRIKANNPPGEWNRYVITMRDNKISVELNGSLIIDNALLPGIAKEGRIALQDDHAKNNRFQFGNLYIKELK